MDFQVPAALAASPMLGDERGRRWLAELPARVARAVADWDLGPDPSAPVRHGAHAVVVPVTWAGAAAVLRVGRAEPLAPAALRLWDGNGAVRLLAADAAGEVCLLERLDGSCTLLHVDPLRAARLANAVVRRLAVLPSGGTAVVFPTTGDDARRLARTLAEQAHGTVPAPWVRLAVDRAEVLAGRRTRGVLVHADLTRENVVHRPGDGGGEFVAVDPRPVVGDPERSAPEFLLRSVDATAPGTLGRVLREFTAGLDHDLARDWALVRIVEHWAWAVRAGLTEDPVRCHRVVAELFGPP